MKLTMPRLSEISTFADRVQSIDSFRPEPDIWVKLRDRPDDYSDDEALLLCETEMGAWLGWVPGYGSIELRAGEFYRLTQTKSDEAVFI